jgi:hypothetical protein
VTTPIDHVLESALLGATARISIDPMLPKPVLYLLFSESGELGCGAGRTICEAFAIACRDLRRRQAAMCVAALEREEMRTLEVYAEYGGEG